MHDHDSVKKAAYISRSASNSGPHRRSPSPTASAGPTSCTSHASIICLYMDFKSFFKKNFFLKCRCPLDEMSGTVCAELAQVCHKASHEPLDKVKRTRLQEVADSRRQCSARALASYFDFMNPITAVCFYPQHEPDCVRPRGSSELWLFFLLLLHLSDQRFCTFHSLFQKKRETSCTIK